MRCLKRLFSSGVVSTGFAMFSMFFGAGNVVFPLAVGRYAGNKVFFAAFGFILTAVFIPFIGLVGTILFDGDYKKYFDRIGRVPGKVTVFFLMALVGPFLAIPRCVTISFSTVKTYLPGVSLFYFSLIASAVLFVLAVRKSKVVDILGMILSPILIISLLVIIAGGIFYYVPPAQKLMTNTHALANGIIQGYNTMDLLGAFFFASVVIASLKLHLDKAYGTYSISTLIKETFKAGFIGLSLLGFICVGLNYITACYGHIVGGIGEDELIREVAFRILGPWAGLVVSVAVSAACLTTAIVLSVIFADFLRDQVLLGKIEYRYSLLVTTVITFAMANLGFSGIARIFSPVLEAVYPALIMIAFVNVAYKLFGIKSVKLPVYTTLFISLLWVVLSHVGIV